MTDVFIAWVGFQRRAEVMKNYWGYDLIHLKNKYKDKKFRVIDYFQKTIASANFINKNKPKNIWIQLPPSVFLYYLWIFKGDRKIVADFHNSMLRDQWFKMPFVKHILESVVDVVVVHNDDVKDELVSKGLSGKNIIVLEDKSFKVSRSFSGVEKIYGDYMLFPCSFDIDEPIDVVIRCAEVRSDINFVVTGKHAGKIAQSVIENAPKNVFFTGYVSNEDYNELLCGAFGVLGLTTRENVQLSVANEAVSAGIPMVLSGTATLKKLFGKGAVFVETTNHISMANGILALIECRQKYEAECADLLNERNERWSKQAKNLKSRLEN